MPSKLVIIVLNIPKKWSEYAELNDVQQIAYIKKHITDICEELKTSHPDATWIIVWREYGVIEGINARSISSATKKIFKEEMTDLVKRYSNLRIIAGTVATISNKSLEKAKEHFSLYAQKSVLRMTKEEKKLKQSEFSNHANQFAAVLLNMKDLPDKNPIKVMRNTCYIFSPEVTQRREKNLPFKELNLEKDKKVDDFTVYRVGKENKSIDPIIKINDLKGRKFTVGIEICQEHSSGFLKYWLEEEKTPLPLIHFVESDTVMLYPGNFCGSYVIQLDSVFAPKLITPNPLLISKSDPSVELYSSDILKPLKKESKMLMTVPSLYPFECKVLNIFDQSIAKFSGDYNPRKLYLERMKELFCRQTLWESDQVMIDFLESMFKPTQRIYFIKSSDDNLNYETINKMAWDYPGIVLHQDKIYYIDHEKKSFKRLDDKYKIIFIEYFKNKSPVTFESNEKKIAAIESSIGIKSNEMLIFLKERYWWHSNPMIAFKNNINLLLREYQKRQEGYVENEYRASDLREKHLRINRMDVKAEEQLLRLDKKEEAQPPVLQDASLQSSPRSLQASSEDRLEDSRDSSKDKDPEKLLVRRGSR